MNIEHAWAAGFFEGEGSVQARPSRTELTIVSTEPELLRRFGKAVNAGTLRLRNKARQPTHRDAYYWRLTDRDGVLAVATLLRPYMTGEKTARLDLLINAGPRTRTGLSARVGFHDLT